MSRVAWTVAVCLLATLSAAPAHADATTPTPTPTPTPARTSPALPVPVVPTPSAGPTSAPAGPVARLAASVSTSDVLALTWQPGAGDTGYTVTATTGRDVRRVRTPDPQASFAGLPPGARITVVVVATGAGGDSPPVSLTTTVPAVPAVTGVSVRSVAAGLQVSWHAGPGTPAGTRFLVELRGVNGSVRSRLVASTVLTLSGLTRGGLYFGSITAVSDSGRSTPATVPGTVWAPPRGTEAAPVVVAPAGGEQGAGSPTATTAADPAAAPAPTAQRTVIGSPVAAAVLAGLATVLGALAIGLLLHRQHRS